MQPPAAPPPPRPAADPRVVVLVPTLNNAADLERCLTALDGQRHRPFAVLVVDSGSTDGTREVARRHGARYLDTATSNRADACNAGLAAAGDAEVVVFTDDDCYPPPEWLGNLVRHFSRPEVAGVGGPSVAPPDQGTWGRAADVAMTARWYTAGTRYGKQGGGFGEIAHNPGCNAAYRREVLVEVGGMPAGSIGGEDVDLDARLTARGHRLWYDPRALTYHRRRESLGALFRMGRSYGRGRAHVNAAQPAVASPLHALPAVGVVTFLLLAIGGPVAAGLAAAGGRVGGPAIAALALAPVLAAGLFYLAGVAGSVAGDSPYRSARTAVLAPVCLAALLSGYGLGYLVGARETARRRPRGDELAPGRRARGR